MGRPCVEELQQLVFVSQGDLVQSSDGGGEGQGWTAAAGTVTMRSATAALACDLSKPTEAELTLSLMVRLLDGQNKDLQYMRDNAY